MRGYYLLLFLLLCTLAAAQQVNVTVSVLQSNSLNVYRTISVSQPYTNVTFGQSTLISDLKVSAYSSCSGSSTLRLCVFFNNDLNTFVCSPFQSGLISFTHNPVAANVVTFTYQGNAQYCSYNIFSVNQIQYTGGPGVVFTKQIQLVNKTAPESLGRLSAIINTGGQPAVISSSNPRLVAWFTQSGLLSPTSRTSTNTPSDEAVICLNTDLNKDLQNNPLCDYVDAQVCYTKNSDWLMGNCCGDSPYQSLQFYSDKQAICGRDSHQRLKWASLASVGEVVDLKDTPGIFVVSNGSKFFTCDQVPAGLNVVERFQGMTSISGRDYLCDGSQIVECGGDFPVSVTGVRTGGKHIAGNSVYYCAKNGSWVQSLDSAGRESCERASLTWTGSRCCGEVNDALSTYEDRYVSGSGVSPGSCYKNQFVPSGGLVPGTRTHINYLGEFYYCDVANTSSQVFNNTGIVPKVSRPCDLPLQNALLAGSKQHILCMPSGSWVFTDSADVHYRKNIKWSAGIDDEREGCCPLNYCWDGDECVQTNVVLTKGNKGYRCQ